MKLIVTGASGFLGSRIASYLKETNQVLIPPHGELDITDPDTIERYFRLHRPDAVIHCAAISDTGYCEEHPLESSAINLSGTAALAGACCRHGAKLVAMSSDQVYNGVKSLTPNSEDQTLSPVSVYARHKHMAEQAALNSCPDAVLLRLTWLFDFPVRYLKTNRNLVTSVFSAACTGSPVFFSDRDYRAMTYVWELVMNMPAILSLPGGIYNAGSENTLSAYDTAVYTAELAGFSASSLVRKREGSQGMAPRNLMISTDKIRRYGIRFSDTKDAVKRCLSDFGLS